MGSEAVIPLLKPSTAATGATSSFQTAGNIIVSVVGTGVLGLPFAFRIAGWLAGSIGVVIAGLASYCCMLKLVECRNRISSEGDSSEKVTYGDLGYKALGRTGRFVTEFLILVAQCGGSVAYFVFIGQSLSSVFGSRGLTFEFGMMLLVPIEIALSFVRTLSALAPFSIFADLCNAVAIAIVLRDDLRAAAPAAEIKAVTADAGGLPFAGGMAVFCFEGFGMTLALEASMRERAAFPRVVGLSFVGITAVYVLFGLFGYRAYGDQTKDIVTLNLPDDWSAIAVQIGLCLALMFTLPIMIHPIHEIIEGKLKGVMRFRKHRVRAHLVRTASILPLGVVRPLSVLLAKGHGFSLPVGWAAFCCLWDLQCHFWDKWGLFFLSLWCWFIGNACALMEHGSRNFLLIFYKYIPRLNNKRFILESHMVVMSRCICTCHPFQFVHVTQDPFQFVWREN